MVQTTGEAVWEPCKHYGFYFKHWFRTFFVCVHCGTVFTKKEIKDYKEFMKNMDGKEDK